MAMRRIRKEYNDVLKNPIPWVSFQPQDKNIFNWTVLIRGPVNTPYEAGVWSLNVNFPQDYPFKPPKLQFTTKIYHPTVTMSSGSFCLDMICDNWSPARTITKIVHAIIRFIRDPIGKGKLQPTAILNVPKDCCHEPEIMELLKTNPTKFQEKVREHTKKHASDFLFPIILWSRSPESALHIPNTDNKCHFDRLPEEMIRNVFKFLNLYDLILISSVCRKWRKISYSPQLWQSFSLADHEFFFEVESFWYFVKHLKETGCYNIKPVMNLIPTRFFKQYIQDRM